MDCLIPEVEEIFRIAANESNRPTETTVTIDDPPQASISYISYISPEASDEPPSYTQVIIDDFPPPYNSNNIYS